jgi:AmmeMemoRadiSam system protein B
MKIREPAVAGTFYPGSAEKIKSLISGIHEEEKDKFDKNLSGKIIIGGIVPHAGFVYSGYEAVHFFSLLPSFKDKIETVIIFNPDHKGLGPKYSTDINEVWKTPIGNFNLDRDLISEIKLPESEAAHRFEHSAEVMLPFLKFYLNYDVKILPVCINKQTPEVSMELAKVIQAGVLQSGRKVLFIASSDFCHFVKPEIGFQLDSEVIDSILNLDTVQVFNRISAKNISVCGFGPIMTLMEIGKSISPDIKVKVLARGNSAKSRQSEQVVDYVSVLFYIDP